MKVLKYEVILINKFDKKASITSDLFINGNG